MHLDQTLANRVPKVRRDGIAGRYVHYRRAEVLVPEKRWDEVAELLGAERDRLTGSVRSQQRRAKHRHRPAPFGWRVYAFHDNKSGQRTVPQAITKLAGADIAAEPNYVSPPSPMGSHAVSNAEPADLHEITPPLALHRDQDSRVAVLDTGRPRYVEGFRTYYRTRFEQPTDNSPSDLADDLDETERIFATPGTAATARTADDNDVPSADVDTMVTAFGRLTHPHAGHGLFVSSIVARTAPGAKIVALATMSDDSIADLYEILVDLQGAVDNGCHVINLSLGFHSWNDQCPTPLHEAITDLSNRGHVLVASAGNDGSDREMWPAAHPKVVAVAATDERGLPAEWSNYGGWVNACAPGQDIVSQYVFADWDYPDGTAKRFRGAARWTGTSFSAPYVTALIAKRVMVDRTTARAAWEALEKHGQIPVDEDGDALHGYGVYLGEPHR